MIKTLNFDTTKEKLDYRDYTEGQLYKIQIKGHLYSRGLYWLGVLNDSYLYLGRISLKRINREEAFELMTLKEKREELWNLND